MRSRDLRGKAIQELLKTEESYINQLNTLQKVIYFTLTFELINHHVIFDIKLLNAFISISLLYFISITFQYFVEPCSQLALLSPSIHAKVFGELPALQALNKELYEKLCSPLNDLEELLICQKDGENNKNNSTNQRKPYSEWDMSNFLQINVGEAFLEIAPFFKVYASYASNYQQNLITIEVSYNH